VVNYQVADARSSLNSAQQDVETFTKQQKDFSDLVRTQADSRLIDAQLATLFADDVRWPGLLASLQPKQAGVRLTGVGAELNTAGGTARGNGNGKISLPSTTKERLVGKLTITGVGPDKTAVADYVDGLATVKGVGNPLLSDAAPQGGRVSFTVQLDITAAALSNRYAVDNNARIGGK
jgi:hypothetical protein